MAKQFPFEKFVSLNKLNKDKANDVNNLTSNELNQYLHSSLKTTSYPKNEPSYTQNAVNFSKTELNSLCEELISHVKSSVSHDIFNTYFNNTFSISEIKNKTIFIQVATSFLMKMIKEHHIPVLQNASQNTLGEVYHIEITVKNSGPIEPPPIIQQTNPESNNDKQYLFKKGKNVRQTSFKIQDLNNNNDLTLTNKDLMDGMKSKVMDHMSNLDSIIFDQSKTFDNFVVGTSNNMAHAFSVAVSRNPGKVYPSLYLHGNSGLGKTHLLHAICNQINKSNPQLKICLITANNFMTEMIESIKEKKDKEFRKKYSDKTDVLIIDDIHELKDKKRTQEEFFHIFNELQRKNKQLIFTSDKEPKFINGIEERIKSRLSSALVVEIQQPDLETRIAILRKKALETDIYLNDEVVNLIASCVKNNVRELEGSLIQLGAYSNIMNVDIDVEIAKQQLKLQDEIEDKIITMESITRSVATYFKVSIGDLRGKSRIKDVTKARHVAMYMIYSIIKNTYESIGDYFGKRDHTTIMYAVRNIKKQIKTDPQLKQKLFEIESSL